MTNIEKYTPAWGFEFGVVVEIYIVYGGLTATSYFHHVDETKLWLNNEYKYSEDPSSITFPDIKSIRILTGPWAVWQFAPADAVGVTVVPNSDIPLVFDHDGDLPLEKVEGAVYMPRPWWMEGK